MPGRWRHAAAGPRALQAQPSMSQQAIVPGIPKMILLFPGIFEHSKLVRAMLRTIAGGQQGGVRGSVQRLSKLVTRGSQATISSTKSSQCILACACTRAPFDSYLRTCPEELKTRGLFNSMFLKWAASEMLQKPTAQLLAAEVTKHYASHEVPKVADQLSPRQSRSSASGAQSWIPWSLVQAIEPRTVIPNASKQDAPEVSNAPQPDEGAGIFPPHTSPRPLSPDSDSSSNAGNSAPESKQKMRHSVGRRRSVQDIIRRRRSHLMDDQEEQRSHGGAWIPPPSRFPAPVGWKPSIRAERAAQDGGQTVRRNAGQTARGDGGQTARYGGQTARNRLVQRSRPRPIQAAHGGDTARDRPPTQRTLGAARMASREEATLRKQPGQI